VQHAWLPRPCKAPFPYCSTRELSPPMRSLVVLDVALPLRAPLRSIFSLRQAAPYPFASNADVQNSLSSFEFLFFFDLTSFNSSFSLRPSGDMFLFLYCLQLFFLRKLQDFSLWVVLPPCFFSPSAFLNYRICHQTSASDPPLRSEDTAHFQSGADSSPSLV